MSINHTLGAGQLVALIRKWFYLHCLMPEACYSCFYFPDRSLSGKYILQIDNTVLKFSQIIPFRDVKYFDFAQIVVLVPRGDQD